MIGIRIPFFPPSVNEAYFTKGNLRVLRPEGKRFKLEVQNYLGKYCADFLRLFQRPDEEYEILFIMHFAPDTIYNKTWTEKEGVRRHKKNDASNRVKLIEDAIASCAGFDDAQNIISSVMKTEVSPGQQPGVEIWAWGEEEDGPVASFVGRRTPPAARS